MATLWNFQFSANVWVVTEAQRPWSDIMAEEFVNVAPVNGNEGGREGTFSFGVGACRALEYIFSPSVALDFQRCWDSRYMSLVTVWEIMNPFISFPHSS